jgi:hypothetical protein
MLLSSHRKEGSFFPFVELYHVCARVTVYRNMTSGYTIVIIRPPKHDLIIFKSVISPPI